MTDRQRPKARKAGNIYILLTITLHHVKERFVTLDLEYAATVCLPGAPGEELWDPREPYQEQYSPVSPPSLSYSGGLLQG